MKHKLSLKDKAISLRRRGFSFREISEKLKISKSTASLWTRDNVLSLVARKRLDRLSVTGRKKALETNKRKKLAENKEILGRANGYFDKVALTKDYCRIACALLYWCEGSKHRENKAVSFMNADPKMIEYFLYVFRNSFDLDENKFRALIHLHEYHDENKQLRFWSEITGVPISRFNKSYFKKHTGKNKKDGYPGCLSVRYFDNKIYKELMLTIDKLAKIKMRG